MIVMKFGGSSVSTGERIRTILSIVRKHRKKSPVVVVSAVRGVTDLLVKYTDANAATRKKIIKKIETIHSALLKELYPAGADDTQIKFIGEVLHQIVRAPRNNLSDAAYYDSIVQYGEILSSGIISEFLRSQGMQSKQIIADTIVKTDDIHGSADFLPKETGARCRAVLSPLVRRGIVPVVTGFIGSTTKGRVTTLGRGGSDYSAAVIGYALKASEIQIWTDVDGIYSSDPRYIPDAQLLPTVSYREASELAAFGAKVLHPRTIRPAIAAGVPVRILNTLNPASRGTLVTSKPSTPHHVAAVTAKKKITLVNLYSTEMLFSKGFLERIFGVFARHNLSVNLVSVSEVSVSVSFDNIDSLDGAEKELKKFTTVSKTTEYGMVSLIGEGIVGIKSILRNVFSLLHMYGIEVHMISLGATDINISIVVPSDRVDEACRILHTTMIIQKGGVS